MKHFKITVIVLVALLWAGSAMASVNLVQNGDFEILPSDIAAGSWGTFSSLPPWELDSGPAIEVQHGHNSQLGNPSHYVELDSNDNSAMKQDIFGLVDGQSYTLSFDYFNRINDPEYTSDIYVAFGGFSYTTDWYDQEWTTLSQTFTYNGANLASLIFTAVGESESLGGYIDNVSLTAVPVPGAALLLGSALLSLVGMRKKFSV